MAAEDLNQNLGNANRNAQDLKDALGDILFEQRSLADEARGFAKGGCPYRQRRKHRKSRQQWQR